MKIHVISETSFLVRGTGIHTAFLDHIRLLREKNDITVVVNGQGKGDVFHSHTYFLYYFWKGWNYRGRRVFTAHVIPDSIKGSFPCWKFLYPFVRWGLKKVYDYADVCIAISPMVEQAILKTGAHTRIVRIGNPVYTEIWKRTDEKRREGRSLLGIAENEFVVLGVGQVQKRKGVEDFLDVAEAFPDTKFVWAGGRPFGAFTEGVVRINERFRKAGPNVIRTGQLSLDIMPSIYAAADLMLFPSWQENCPLAPLEAAASGLPVIFRDIPEYSLLYESPYLKAGSTKEFMEMTSLMISNTESYSRGKEISAQLVRQFDKDEIRRRLISLYQSLMNT